MSDGVVANLGTEPNRFTIELFNGETGMQAGRMEDLSVYAQGSLQLNSLLADYAAGVTQGYVRVAREIRSRLLPMLSSSTVPGRAKDLETAASSIVHRDPQETHRG
jgi:hypothetical protein